MKFAIVFLAAIFFGALTGKKEHAKCSWNYYHGSPNLLPLGDFYEYLTPNVLVELKALHSCALYYSIHNFDFSYPLCILWRTSLLLLTWITIPWCLNYLLCLELFPRFLSLCLFSSLPKDEAVFNTPISIY